MPIFTAVGADPKGVYSAQRAGEVAVAYAQQARQVLLIQWRFILQKSSAHALDSCKADFPDDSSCEFVDQLLSALAVHRGDRGGVGLKFRVLLTQARLEAGASASTHILLDATLCDALFKVSDPCVCAAKLMQGRCTSCWPPRSATRFLKA